LEGKGKEKGKEHSWYLEGKVKEQLLLLEDEVNVSSWLQEGEVKLQS
jgi:hypothetical protein